jgi:Galactose oxidase, central domain
MKTEYTSRIGFLNPRGLTHFVLYATGLIIAFAPMRSATAGDNAAMELSQSGPAQLPNGQVLVAGGISPSGDSPYLASAELYDPATGMWTATGSMVTARYGHTATLLPNGQVLVAGGDATGVTPQLYDPATGVWTATGSMVTARDFHTATLLPNGQVLVVGGIGASGFLASAELYDPASGMWTATGSITTRRYSHTATLLPNGQVLVAAGFQNGSRMLKSAELYDPATGSWTATANLAPRALVTGRRCCRTGRCLSQEGTPLTTARLRAHNSTNRRHKCSQFNNAEEICSLQSPLCSCVSTTLTPAS